MSGWVVVCRNRRCQRAFEVDREGWDFPGSTSTLVSILFLYYTEVDLSSLVISARFCCMLQRPALRSGIIESQNGLSCKEPQRSSSPKLLAMGKDFRGNDGHGGLVGMMVMGWRLDLMILVVFSNHNDSLIL